MKKKLSVLVSPILVLSVLLSGCGAKKESVNEITNAVMTTEPQTTPSAKPVVTSGAPWKEYEEAKYKIIVNGVDSGEIDFIQEKTDFNGKKAYKLTSSAMLMNARIDTVAIVDSESFMPFSSEKRINAEGQPEQIVKGEYKEKLYLEASADKDKQSKSLDLPREYQDNEAITMAIRAFPLGEGFSKEVNIASTTAGQIFNASIAVRLKEKIMIQSGEFECYMVEMTIKDSPQTEPIRFWYTTDEKKTLVKYIQGQQTFVLASIKYGK